MRIGLFHALKTCLEPQSIVATSSYTIYDINNIIKNAGHTPLLVDIDLDHLGPNINKLIELIKNRLVDCVIFTHLHGYSVDLKELSDVCKDFGCLLVEDCAQSLWNRKWSEYNFIPGIYGDIALYSTGFFKNVNTISGGMLLISSKSIYKEKIVKDYGKLGSCIDFDFVVRIIYSIYFSILTNNFVFNSITYPLLKFSFIHQIEFFNKRAREENSPHYIARNKENILRMNFLQRWLFRKKSILELDTDYAKRKNLAMIYISQINELLQKGYIHIPGFRIGNLFNFSCYNQIPILVEDRHSLLDYLYRSNHDIAAQHIKDLSIEFSYFSIVPDVCANSAYVARRIVLLPCYPDFPESEVERLCKNLTKYFSLK